MQTATIQAEAERIAAHAWERQERIEWLWVIAGPLVVGMAVVALWLDSVTRR